MKETKQLEKRILEKVKKEQWNEGFRKAILEGRLTGKTQYWIETVDIMMKKVINETLKDVCEEMKKVFDRELRLQTVGTDTIDKIEELLKEFQGEENA